MDGLASVGRAFATPQFIVASLFGIALIIGGIVVVSSPVPPAQPMPTPPGGKPIPAPQQSKGARTIGGIVMIIIGAIIPFAAWWRRKLIRSNPTVAALVGFLDVERMIKVAIS